MAYEDVNLRWMDGKRIEVPMFLPNHWITDFPGHVNVGSFATIRSYRGDANHFAQTLKNNTFNINLSGRWLNEMGVEGGIAGKWLTDMKYGIGTDIKFDPRNEKHCTFIRQERFADGAPWVGSGGDFDGKRSILASGNYVETNPWNAVYWVPGQNLTIHSHDGSIDSIGIVQAFNETERSSGIIIVNIGDFTLNWTQQGDDHNVSIIDLVNVVDTDVIINFTGPVHINFTSEPQGNTAYAVTCRQVNRNRYFFINSERFTTNAARLHLLASHEKKDYQSNSNGGWAYAYLPYF